MTEKTQLDNIERMLNDIHRDLHGEPGRHYEGALTRLDRLEQRVARQMRWQTAAMSGVIALVVAVASTWVSISAIVRAVMRQQQAKLVE